MTSSQAFSPTPSWLDPTKEITNPDQPKDYHDLNNNLKAVAFIFLSMKALYTVSQNLNINQIIGVIANSVSETGWGKSWKGWNFGGWKITKPEVDKIKLISGEPPRWWKADGHIASGDPPVCYYKAFSGPDQFYLEWLGRFVPSAAPENSRYYKTGKAFWANSQTWFKEMCLAGYKGVVTAANPDPSVASWATIIKSIKQRVAQELLSVEPDGIWGKRSKEACIEFQNSIGRTASGELDDMTFLKLVSKWKNEGMKIPYIKG